jgi:hypothetical protein
MVFAPGDPERASRAVTIDTLAELGCTLGEGVRGRLLEEDAQSPLGVIFLAPAAGTVAGETVKVRLGISSRDGTNIAALDVHRLSPGATPVRWKASEAEVAEISRRIALLADKARYAVFELPSEIALEPGDNILKVRVLRSDRKLVTRSIACVRE